jgi:hypothetical protein
MHLYLYHVLLQVGEMEAIEQASLSTLSYIDQQVRYIQQMLQPALPVVYPSGAEDVQPVEAVALLISGAKFRAFKPLFTHEHMKLLTVLVERVHPCWNCSWIVV